MGERMQETLLRELETLPLDADSHIRRREIGDQLASLGDTRPGVTVVDERPDILWLRISGSDGAVTFRDIAGETRGHVSVNSFQIAKFPVTFSQYQAFVDSEAYDNPRWWAQFPEAYHPQSLTEAKNTADNAPRDRVSWYQAVAFARWLDAQYRTRGIFEQVLSIPATKHEIRLPTEWEWQWAAQNGAERRAYPWGDWQNGYANTREAALGRTTAIGMYPHAAAQCGALDMTGNVCEWCLNKVDDPTQWAIDDSGDKRVLRGGSHLDDYDMGHSAFRFGDDTPDVVSGLNGFRLVIAPTIAL